MNRKHQEINVEAINAINRFAESMEKLRIENLHLLERILQKKTELSEKHQDEC